MTELLAADPLHVWTDSVITWREGLVAGKTTSTERYHQNHGLPALLKDQPLATLTPLSIEEAVAQMLRVGRSRRTVRRSLSILRTILDRAVTLGAIHANPATGLTVPPGTGTPPTPINPFTAADLRTVVTAQRQLSQLADLTLVLGLTGLRWGEARELRSRDVQSAPFPALRVSRSCSDGHQVKTTKSGRPRLIPLVPEAAAIILTRIDNDPNRLIFPSTAETPILGPNFRRAVHWPTTGRGRRIHDLRHTAATLWLGAGLDPKTVQTWLGHQSAQLTLDLYGHWRGLDADAAALARFTIALSA